MIKRLDSNVGAMHPGQINPFLVSAEEQISIKYKPRIWGNIETTEDFLFVIEVLETAKENDIVELHVSSMGGSIDAISTLIHAMQKCEAPIHVVMTGSVCSAGTIPMFFSDSWEAGEYTSFMFHEAILGSPAETMSANKAYTAHIHKFCEKMMRDIYEGFFTEEELCEIFSGKQIWLLPEDVSTRFKIRMELFDKKCEDNICEEDEPLTVCDDDEGGTESPPKQCQPKCSCKH